MVTSNAAGHAVVGRRENGELRGEETSIRERRIDGHGQSNKHESDAEEGDEEDEEDDEEDEWLEADVAKLVAEEEAAPKDEDAYKPQLMDEREMLSLRRDLRTSEARLESDGRLREFVPRKPVASLLVVCRRPLTRDRSRRHRRGNERPVTSGAKRDERQEDEDEDDADPFKVLEGHEQHKREYADALRDEMEQYNELLDRFEDTKRHLLDHVDMVCSTKPADRVGAQDAYEKLDELLAFAAACRS